MFTKNKFNKTCFIFQLLLSLRPLWPRVHSRQLNVNKSTCLLNSVVQKMSSQIIVRLPVILLKSSTPYSVVSIGEKSLITQQIFETLTFDTEVWDIWHNLTDKNMTVKHRNLFELYNELIHCITDGHDYVGVYQSLCASRYAV